MPAAHTQAQNAAKRRERRLDWIAGARTSLAGWSFALNPHAPPPVYTDSYAYSPSSAERGRNWATGFWWADRALRGPGKRAASSAPSTRAS